MHCQRFIVQGFNGALTPLPPSLPPSVCGCLPPSSHARKHARHPSLGPPPLPVFPSPLRLPSISRPSPFTFHFSASASHSFFSPALPSQTASITSSVTRLIGSGKRKKKKGKKKYRRQSRLRWNGKRINHRLCFRGCGGEEERRRLHANKWRRRRHAAVFS